MPDVLELLTTWVPRQRWYAAKDREDARLEIVADVRLSDLLRHLVVQVTYPGSDQVDSYQVPLTVRPDAPYGHESFLVGESDEGLVYDGLRDPDGSAVLLGLLREKVGTTAEPAATEREGLTFSSMAELQDAPGQAMGAEQSNTSIVYGDAYILKVFRRLAPGENPDLEITRALAAAGSTNVPTPLGYIEGAVAGRPTTLGLLQEFLRSGTEGWKLATASVRDLYAEGDLHPDEVGGDFAGEAERLGQVTAEVHQLMARTLPTETVGPEEARALSAQMQSRLDDALTVVEELRAYEEQVREVYAQVADLQGTRTVQRVHGDFHLGQVLRVDSGWVLFDFEGEPARPLSERTALMSPLRDVAGMLRSFDYAAQSMLREREGEQALEYRALEWAERNRGAFCDGYASAGGPDPREHRTLLRAFELDKAVYEVLYEARHRPTWLSIPLGSIERVARAD